MARFSLKRAAVYTSIALGGYIAGAATFNDVAGYFRGGARELAHEVGRDIAADTNWRKLTGCAEKGRKAQAAERTWVALRARRIMLAMQDNSGKETIVVYSPEWFENNSDFKARISRYAADFCKTGAAPS